MFIKIIVKLLLTSRNCVTEVSTTIRGRSIRCNTPFFNGIFPITILAITTPVACLGSPTSVSDLIYSKSQYILINIE